MKVEYRVEDQDFTLEYVIELTISLGNNGAKDILIDGKSTAKLLDELCPSGVVELGRQGFLKKFEFLIEHGIRFVKMHAPSTHEDVYFIVDGENLIMLRREFDTGNKNPRSCHRLQIKLNELHQIPRTSFGSINIAGYIKRQGTQVFNLEAELQKLNWPFAP